MKRSRPKSYGKPAVEYSQNPDSMNFLEYEIYTVQQAVQRGHSQATVLNRTMSLGLHDWKGLDKLRAELGLKPRGVIDQAPADSDA